MFKKLVLAEVLRQAFSASAAPLRAGSCKAQLGKGARDVWGASSISLVQSFAEDVDSFLSRTGDISDAFQSFVSLNRSRNVNLLKGYRLLDSCLGRGGFGAQHFSASAALLRAGSCKAHGALPSLGGAQGMYGVQSFAEDVGSFLSRTGDSSDAFQSFVSLDRSKNVNLLKGY